MGVTQGAIYANGHRVGGCDLTVNNGVFIDPNNVIYRESINEGTIVHTTYSYTATEDCYLYFSCMAGGSSNDSCHQYIDGETVGAFAHIDYKLFSNLIPLKTGQVFSADNLGYWCGIKVYGIQAGSFGEPKVTTYHGVPVTANIYDDGYCNLTRVEFDDFILYNLDFTIHIKGTSTGVEFLPFYTFDSGVLDDIDWRSMLTYCVYNDTYFARVRTKKEVNALGGYYGNFTISDGWYSCTPTTFLVQKNQPAS